MNDPTKIQYSRKMTEICGLGLGFLSTESLGFLSVFPHNTMEIKKQKADTAAFKASSLVWESYPAVREAHNDIENTLYLACNDVFIPSLIDEVAKLQVVVERAVMAFENVKGNQHMAAYRKEFPAVFQKPKDLVKVLVSDLKILCLKYGVDLDEKSVYAHYKAGYTDLMKLEKEK